MGQFNLNDIGFARANNFLSAVLDQAKLAGASGKGQAIICRPDGTGIHFQQLGAQLAGTQVIDA